MLQYKGKLYILRESIESAIKMHYNLLIARYLSIVKTLKLIRQQYNTP